MADGNGEAQATGDEMKQGLLLGDLEVEGVLF
jgi:hypothetical protein